MIFLYALNKVKDKLDLVFDFVSTKFYLHFFLIQKPWIGLMFGGVANLLHGSGGCVILCIRRIFDSELLF